MQSFRLYRTGGISPSPGNSYMGEGQRGGILRTPGRSTDIVRCVCSEMPHHHFQGEVSGVQPPGDPNRGMNGLRERGKANEGPTVVGSSSRELLSFLGREGGYEGGVQKPYQKLDIQARTTKKT